MRKPKPLASFPLLILLTLGPVRISAQSPSQPSLLPSGPEDDAWNRLSIVDPWATVSVRTSHGTMRCQNLHVTDDHLSCDVESWWFPTQYLSSDRGDVLSVRQRHDKRNFWLVVGAGSLAGGIFAAVSYTPTTSYTRGADAIGGAAVFGLISAVVAYPIALVIPGHTLYRQMTHSPRTLSHAVFHRRSSPWADTDSTGLDSPGREPSSAGIAAR